MVPEFRHQQKPRQLRWSLITITLILGIAIVFLVITNVRLAQRRARLTEQRDLVAEEIAQLEQKITEAEVRVQAAEDETYIERVAREQLGLKSPGEEVVVITREHEEQPDTAPAPEEKKSWWERVKNFFGFR